MQSIEDRINIYVEGEIQNNQHFTEGKQTFHRILEQLEEQGFNRKLILDLESAVNEMWVFSADVSYRIGFKDAMNLKEGKELEF